jgi:hypothetical protein
LRNGSNLQQRQSLAVYLEHLFKVAVSGKQ